MNDKLQHFTFFPAKVVSCVNSFRKLLDSQTSHTAQQLSGSIKMIQFVAHKYEYSKVLLSLSSSSFVMMDACIQLGHEHTLNFPFKFIQTPNVHRPARRKLKTERWI